MPPKTSRTPARKQSVSKDVPLKMQTSMPPPPDPPQPQGILVPEVMALSTCFRNAVVKTGQIYGHYSDTRKLGIHKYAPYPPRSLTASLGREVEKYDQLCDAIESHLLYAISVLQRDLRNAQDRLQAAAAVPMAVSPASAPTTLPPSDSPTQSISADDGTVQSETKQPSSGLRRASTISLSSLQRPPFPHKLDLSSAALRINPDDHISLQSGLASPVTLAPKSSISRHPPDFLGGGQHIDIDLTLDDEDMSLATRQLGAGPAGIALGNSADKPIELDLDLGMDLFGGGSHSQSVTGTSAPHVSPVIVPKQEETSMDLSILDSVGPGGLSQGGLLGFNSAEMSTGPQMHAHEPQQPSQSSSPPGSLLSGLQQAGSNNGESNFGFDLNFLEPMDMHMDDIFHMNGTGQPQSGENNGPTRNQ